VISPEFLLFLAFAIFACAFALLHEDADRKDAYRRNHDRTWDDRP
jgi:hypothetical protein